MNPIALIFPNQLFADSPVLRVSPEKVLLIEHSLFFGDDRYPAKFHKQKIAYHRATMSAYGEVLKKRNLDVELMPYKDAVCCLDTVCRVAKEQGFSEVVVAELNDYSLHTADRRFCKL